MNSPNSIRNLNDLQQERTRVRKLIRQQEKQLHEDYRTILDSLTPARIITGITGKIVTSAPALFTAYALVRSIFGKRKKHKGKNVKGDEQIS